MRTLLNESEFFDKTTFKCTCQRCGHQFFPKLDAHDKPTFQKCCPNCKSRWWNYAFHLFDGWYERLHCDNCGAEYWSCKVGTKCKHCRSLRVRVLEQVKATHRAERNRLLHPDKYPPKKPVEPEPQWDFLQ